MSVSPAYREVVDFIAAGMTPQDLVAFHPSEAAKEQVADLIHREKTTGLTAEETAELNHYRGSTARASDASGESPRTSPFEK